MLETKDLVLDKAKYSDWEKMFRNVWSRRDIAKYTVWRISESEDDAKERILKTIEFQKSHDMYFVYEKKNGEPIGFAGVEKLAHHVYEEAGICLGPDYVGKGFGKQILTCLMEYCKQEFGAKEFIYSAREDNEASRRLAHSLGFYKTSSELREHNGNIYSWIKYSKKL